MEALTGVSVALLTVYDMCKAVDKRMDDRGHPPRREARRQERRFLLRVNAMLDKYGRNIDYLRISITDRCNLRCKYCMPDGCGKVGHEDMLSYEEFLRLARLFAALGVRHCARNGRRAAREEGRGGLRARAQGACPASRRSALTTNGTLLTQIRRGPRRGGAGQREHQPGHDGPALAREDHRRDGVVDARARGRGAHALAGRAREAKRRAARARRRGHVRSLARFAEAGVPVRFIELMPMGVGRY